MSEKFVRPGNAPRVNEKVKLNILVVFFFPLPKIGGSKKIVWLGKHAPDDDPPPGAGNLGATRREHSEGGPRGVRMVGRTAEGGAAPHHGTVRRRPGRKPQVSEDQSDHSEETNCFRRSKRRIFFCFTGALRAGAGNTFLATTTIIFFF